MFGYSDLVKQPMELVDDAINLLGQVAGVHFGRVHDVYQSGSEIVKGRGGCGHFRFDQFR